MLGKGLHQSINREEQTLHPGLLEPLHPAVVNVTLSFWVV